VFCNENQQDRATLKLIFERMRDRTKVWFSQLFFILIDLCENVIHEKLSKTPLPVFPVTRHPVNEVAISAECLDHNKPPPSLILRIELISYAVLIRFVHLPCCIEKFSPT